ncbi:DNA replication protein DnaD [Halalkalibacillus sediminis]|uniref:DNA replication protein DnaD n=1 Tax=Halalkalibacillus sediminis TaxID=2018042 RepID=A0A2I0QWV7_9BACI|nr:DnaD domain-containing protein [Halalkalibacillus sediminis]PKR78821.1 DNA replication protein DnaD [Halalkalibacillus sediminis]
MSLPFSYQQMLVEQLNVPTKLIKSYSSLDLTETDMMVIIQILSFQQQDELLPSFDQLAENMTINTNEVSNILRKLKNQGCLSISHFEDENKVTQEWYSLQPLIEKLYNQEGSSNSKEEEGKLFSLFEQEFGRALSPIEIETISHWLDEDRFNPSLIKTALRESVLMGKLNFRYIDRILNEWKKKGIRSVKDAKKSTNNHQANKQQEPVKKRDTSVYYNWLEE